MSQFDFLKSEKCQLLHCAYVKPMSPKLRPGILFLALKTFTISSKNASSSFWAKVKSGDSE